MRRKIMALIVVTLMFVGISSMLLPLEAFAYLGDRTLKVGMSGYDVTQLQKDLDYLGYETGSADGVFGWRTQAAVKNFQANNGLTADGMVGSKTAQAVIKQVSNPVSIPVSATTTPSRGSFSYSSQVLTDLARLIYGEARGEPFIGQVAVAAVVLNRVYSGKYGSTVREVIHQPGAFTAVSDGQYYLQPNKAAYEAAQAALNGWDPTGNALYYWNPGTATNKWVWSRTIINQIGKHVFAK